VVVDAGILRREDYTMERMEHVRGALEATAGEAWPEYCHVHYTKIIHFLRFFNFLQLL
jgi:hypothetical protein